MYIEQRKKNKIRGKLSSETTPTTSNITNTGQLLDGLYAISERKNQFTILPRESRTDTSVKNSNIIGYLKEKRRVFFGLSKAEVAFLRKEVLALLKRKFRL